MWPSMAKRRSPTGADLVVSTGMVSLGLAGLMLAPLGQPEFRDSDLLAVLLTFSQGVPLVVRRQRPLEVLALVWLGTVAFVMLRYPPVTTALAGVAVAIYAVAAYDSSRPESVRVVVPGVLAALLAGAAMASGYSPAEGAALLLVVVTAWVFGDRVRTRRRYVAALQERTELLERERDVTIEGRDQTLPTAVDLAAYRIVQEALANTLKHSTADRARVVVRYGEDRLVVQVHDAGPRRPVPGPSGGHGLVGMRGRAAMLGGSLEAGPRDDAGYEVLAVLPLRRPPS